MTDDTTSDGFKEPKNRGAYFQEDARHIQGQLLTAKSGSLRLYWIINPSDRSVIRARYFTYGGIDMIVLGEIISRCIIGSEILQ